MKVFQKKITPQTFKPRSYEPIKAEPSNLILASINKTIQLT